MLLLGPPGICKTHFAREIAQLLGNGLGLVSMSSMSSLTAGWVLSGAPSQWKGALPGEVFETLVDGACANPVMVVDEIGKARAEHPYDPLGALHSLLEIDTAGAFTDEFAEVAIDARLIIWVATANDARAIPEPVLIRMNVSEIDAPDPDAARAIALRSASCSSPRNATQRNAPGWDHRPENNTLSRDSMVGSNVYRFVFIHNITFQRRTNGAAVSGHLPQCSAAYTANIRAHPSESRGRKTSGLRPSGDDSGVAGTRSHAFARRGAGPNTSQASAAAGQFKAKLAVACPG